MSPKLGRSKTRRRNATFIAAAIILLASLAAGLYFTTEPRISPQKPIILYVNQGNGAVDSSNFANLTSFATSRGFNTIFFQIYREGVLLFSPAQLSAFVNTSHAAYLKIYFALYLTNSSQSLPSSIYGAGEDGINLDMSTLQVSNQKSLLSGLKAVYYGEIAVTTTDMYSQLTPNLLILETYGSGFNQYIRHGIIASVGVFTTTSEQDYRTQFQYALQNSDGVMVFDYTGLLKRGY